MASSSKGLIDEPTFRAIETVVRRVMQSFLFTAQGPEWRPSPGPMLAKLTEELNNGSSAEAVLLQWIEGAFVETTTITVHDDLGDLHGNVDSRLWVIRYPLAREERWSALTPICDP